MLLTIWRHGEAGPAPRDAERELTERGRSEVAAAAEAFARWLVQSGQPEVEHLRHSPLDENVADGCHTSRHIAPSVLRCR